MSADLGRLWLYSNYHCNLACTYCLTESAPRASRRELGPEAMLELADEAAVLGFNALGVTGGEPFLLPYLPDTLARLAARLPLVVLSNATLFHDRMLARMKPLAGLPVTVQVSLDSAEPVANDGMRGPGNFDRVVEAIPKLVDIGIPVRVATTGAPSEELCELHRSLGVTDDDHVVRPIVQRGRAADHGLGVVATAADLPAELTITVDGSFWSPFGPTVRGGRLDTDLLVTRTIRPLSIATDAFRTLKEGRPAGADATLNIK